VLRGYRDPGWRAILPLVQAGDVVAGRFRIEAVVGQGGMGTVHRAVDQRDGGLVALKTATSPSVDDATRFVRRRR
jgi:serine/threonine protein kinase